MRRLIALPALLCFLAAPAAAASPGSGSPSGQILQSFLNAYARGGFSALVGAPANDVTALGNGFVQEFPPRGGGSGKFALVEPFVAPGPSDTRQMYSDLYAYFQSVGLATTGFPANDTTVCPASSFGTCNYQLFTNNYALFVFPNPAGLRIAVRDPFFTEWNNAGGIGGAFGLPMGTETAVTSASKIQGTSQTYSGGVIFSYPAGLTAPSVYGVGGAFYRAFSAAGGFGTMGLPTSEAVAVNAAGLIRQTFENGRLEQTPGGVPAPVFPIAAVRIQLSGLNLAPGATAIVTAAVTDTQMNSVDGRTLTWSTSNGNVASVKGNGYSATVTAIGPGTASIYVTGEGKTSPALPVTVGSVCCAVGQGAPSAAIGQAFQLALARNGVAVLLPAAEQVMRAGAGYMQTLAAADGSGVVYAVAEADGSGTAYLLSGSLYAAYLAAGGFAGPLGYPVSDALPGGTQKFSSGAALAGMPVRVLPAPVATKWFQSGGATGTAGQPVADAAAFATFGGVAGVSQAFAAGTIFAAASGPSAGQAYFSGGPVLARYLELQGPAGALGLPLGDLYSDGAVQRQNFETGYIDLQAGATVAVDHFNPRHPAVSATPATVTPGGRVHIAVSGFAPGATLNITITGQAGFSVAAPAGAFAWDVVLPQAAKLGTVTVGATVKGSADAASATYSITPAQALLPKLSILSGDRQTGLPGSTLAGPLVVSLVDAGGMPLAGVPVFWTASPGAAVRSDPVTDANGRASGYLRLPLAAGVAVGSVAAGGQVATFSALAAGNNLQNFPGFTQTGAGNGLVPALASLLRYSQNLGMLGTPNGLATPAVLSQFLTDRNGLFPSEAGNAVADPWVAARFASASLWLEATAPEHLRDLLGGGVPVLLLLDMTIDGTPGGSAAVDAIGVDGLGAIAISDPNPAYGQASLADYLNGFAAQGHTVRGVVSGAVRIGPGSGVAGTPFVVASALSAGVALRPAAGACDALDVRDAAGGQMAGVRFQYCEGAQTAYQLDFAAPQGASPAIALDLNAGVVVKIAAADAIAWRIGREHGALVASPQTATITGVTDAAAFGSALSPGGLIAIFGSGFVAGSNVPAVTLGGKAMSVAGAFPFQINAVIPVDTGAGNARLEVRAALGAVGADVTISAVGPGVFVLGAGDGGNPQGAVVNQDGTVNSPAAPARRGEYVSIYCTGLGTTAARGGFQSAVAPTSVVINGMPLVPSFAGSVPGFAGLYQVNVTVPAGLAPGLGGNLQVSAGGRLSNTVAFALQ